MPIGAKWTYEIKLDGYRLQAHRLDDRVVLYSRNGNRKQFPVIAKELEKLPPGTILDGEVAALDDQGRPRFNLLQNYQSSSAHLVYFAFDMLALKERDVTKLALSERRSLLRETLESGKHVQITESAADLEGIERFIKAHQLEGIIAKSVDSVDSRSGGNLKGDCQIPQ